MALDAEMRRARQSAKMKAAWASKTGKSTRKSVSKTMKELFASDAGEIAKLKLKIIMNKFWSGNKDLLDVMEVLLED